MKKKNAKARVSKEAQPEKRRRGRPRLTEAEKAADPRRTLVSSIKADLKRVKKAQKKLSNLITKTQAEQESLLAGLLESLEKAKAALKKLPKKAKAGKRGRPAKKRPGRPVGRPKGKRGRPAKKAVDSQVPKRKRGRPRKYPLPGPAAEKKAPSAAGDKLVVPIPKPGMKTFKKAVAKPAVPPAADGENKPE